MHCNKDDEKRSQSTPPKNVAKVFWVQIFFLQQKVQSYFVIQSNLPKQSKFVNLSENKQANELESGCINEVESFLED